MPFKTATYLVLAEKLLEDLHCTRVYLVDVGEVEDQHARLFARRRFAGVALVGSVELESPQTILQATVVG